MFDSDILVEQEVLDFSVRAVRRFPEHRRKNSRNIGKNRLGPERAEIGGRELFPTEERRVEAFAGGQTAVEDFLIGVAG